MRGLMLVCGFVLMILFPLHPAEPQITPLEAPDYVIPRSIGIFIDAAAPERAADEDRVLR